MQYLGKNTKSLKAINDKYAEYACNKVAEMVKKKLDEFIRYYYHEYSPEQYERTWSFLNSVVKTSAQKQGNTWVATVYIDTSIQYSSYWNGEHWNMGNTAYFANEGQHGRYYNSGSSFFDDAYNEIMNDEHLTSNLASFLKKNGINVTYERYEP